MGVPEKSENRNPQHIIIIWWNNQYNLILGMDKAMCEMRAFTSTSLS